ncbi:TetR/AcrR family transcriptional regulator [Cellulosimicrobium terreum]|nr:TetR/AcrR family transcriptional regulator [Cellulosimicrobium terreum]
MARPRLHDDALRDRLLEVASRAISEHGESTVTVRSVAAAAGTSPSAVYALFGSRDDLVAAVSAAGFRRFAAYLAAAPRTDDPARDLGALALAYRAFALADPHFYAVMFARGVRPGRDAPASVDQDTFRVLLDAVRRVFAPGPGRAGQHDATSHLENVAMGLWGLVHGLVSLELAGLVPGGDPEREAGYVAATRAVGLALAAPPTT